MSLVASSSVPQRLPPGCGEDRDRHGKVRVYFCQIGERDAPGCRQDRGHGLALGRPHQQPIASLLSSPNIFSAAFNYRLVLCIHHAQPPRPIPARCVGTVILPRRLFLDFRFCFFFLRFRFPKFFLAFSGEWTRVGAYGVFARGPRSPRSSMQAGHLPNFRDLLRHGREALR